MGEKIAGMQFFVFLRLLLAISSMLDILVLNNYCLQLAVWCLYCVCKSFSKKVSAVMTVGMI